MSLSIITPTIGSKYLKKAIESIINQTNQNFIYYIVIDGHKYINNVQEILKEYKNLPKNFIILPLAENTGANGWNGHRIYIATSFLTNSDYVMFLDEDNMFEPNHVDTMLKKIGSGNDWTFSLRNIIDKDGKFICPDKCESLGNLHHVWNNKDDFLVDVNCYCIRREIFQKHCLDFNKKARPLNDIEVDRALYKSLSSGKYKFESTGIHSVGYRVGNRDDSVKAEFFIHGNKMMEKNNKNIYVFHLDPNWTNKCLSTNEFDYDSINYLYEDGNKTMLYSLKNQHQYNLINGYKNLNEIPSGSVCFMTIMDIRLIPAEVLKRKDIKKICYLLEGPNSWHANNYDYKMLNECFDKIITYWDGLLNKEKVVFFPFVSRFDMSNKYHKEMISKKRKYDKSIGMILANRENNEKYKINDYELSRLDYLRKKIVIELDNITVHGQGWDDLKNYKYINIENVKNRMLDEININEFYKRFNFALIIENCDAKNYVSEKIYDAWVAGCIPIYYGNKGIINLPENCYIKINQFEESNYKQINEIINKLTKEDIDEYYDNINQNIEKILDNVSPSKLSNLIIELI